MREEEEEEIKMVTPGEVLGKDSDVKPGKGAYLAPHNHTVYASLTGCLSTIPPLPDSPDQRPTVEVIGNKAHGAVPEPGCSVIARVTKVMARMASADIMCVGSKSVREKFTGIISSTAATAALQQHRSHSTAAAPQPQHRSSTAATAPQQQHCSSTAATALQQQHSSSTALQQHSSHSTAAAPQPQHCSSTAAAQQPQHSSSSTAAAQQPQHCSSSTAAAAPQPQHCSSTAATAPQPQHSHSTAAAPQPQHCSHIGAQDQPRQQDVRATEIDKVDMHSSFRPGDIVKALVLSLGDARAYYLSTAKYELGVVSAESTAGGTMVPISWTEMQCPLTGQIEQRKAAKVGA